MKPKVPVGPSIRYGWARLNAEQLAVLHRAVSGASVWDLGCGHDAPFVDELLRGGATRIEAVDPVIEPRPGYRAAQVRFTQARFKDWTPAWPADVALLSWPVNTWMPGLVALLERAPSVVYIGNNVSAACGGPDLWFHLIQRPVLVQVQGATDDTLLVFGAPGQPRCLPPESIPEVHHALAQALATRAALADLRRGSTSTH